MKKDVKSDIIVDFSFDPSKYDSSNQLIIDSKKKNQSKSHSKKTLQESSERILSKKKRKELQKILHKKEKTLNRAELWEQLRALASEPKAENLSSTVQVYSRNRHREQKAKKHATEPKKLKPMIWDLPKPTERDQSSSSEESEDTITESEHETEEKMTNITEDVPVICKISNDIQESHEELRPATPAKFVIVNRKPDIENARLLLPIVAEECRIMESISENDCVIVCGSTGCGKTTQLPQFLYERGYTRDGYKIGITEPRRVAAMAMSERVAEELNLSNDKVSYHIRYEKNTTKDTEIKFMTDGVLLQEIKNDFELTSYSVIIVDEAHERSLFTDVLLGLLSMIVRLRRKAFDSNDAIMNKVHPPLKLIIMSATLSVDEFAFNKRLFPPKSDFKTVVGNPVNSDDEIIDERKYPGSPMVLSVDSRQYPVTCHFSKVTNSDYLKSAFQKVCKIHKDSPAGTILVFVTGQQECLTLCKWLKEAFPKKVSCTDLTCKEQTSFDKMESVDTGKEIEHSEEIVKLNLDNFGIVPTEEEMELCSISVKKKTDQDHANDISDSESEADVDEKTPLDEDLLTAALGDDYQQFRKKCDPIYALPLYSLLPAKQQKRVFEAPPEGHRMVVVSTNVAETSLTIPDVRFVVDTGKEKIKRYNHASGASWFEIVWINQASAEQRAGRAGRIGPGHCYRMYSARVFTDMEKFPTPDILTRPIDDVVLMLKSYLGQISLHRFPLPTSPSFQAIQSAQQRLFALGALETSTLGGRLMYRGEEVTNFKITKSGEWMSNLPVSVRLSRMLLFAHQCELMPYAVILVSALTVPNLLITNSNDNDDTNQSATVSQQEAFKKQFVRDKRDLLLGDFAVILGTLCCLERFSAQLNGLTPIQDDELVRVTGLQKGEICKNTRLTLNADDIIFQLCVKCGIRFKAYKEFRQLRRQLTEILNANIPGLNLDLAGTILFKPSPVQMDRLRQLFLVASPSNLAQKIFLKGLHLPKKERKRLHYAYKVIDVIEPVYIHHSSPINKENFPLVAYLELHTSSKPFLNFVCSVDPEWIPLLAPNSFSATGIYTIPEEETLEQPSKKRSAETSKESKSKRAKNLDNEDSDSMSDTEEGLSVQQNSTKISIQPIYDKTHDTIMVCAKQLVYTGAGHSYIVKDKEDNLADIESAHSFPLPSNLRFPLISFAGIKCLGNNECYMWASRWFARALISGEVFEPPEDLATIFPSKVKVCYSAKTLTASWGLARSEVRKLISAFVDRKVTSKQSLIEQLSKDSEYIFDALSDWIKPESRMTFKSLKF